MKLNLGCGAHVMTGFVNADFEALYSPDVVIPFPAVSLPWDDNTFDEVRAFHFFEYCADSVTEHMAVWKELHRVMKNGALLSLTAFNPLSSDFRDDPEARIAISKKIIDRLFAPSHPIQLTARIPAGLRFGFHFHVEGVAHEFNLKWQRDIKSGKRSEEDVLALSDIHADVIKQSHFKIRALKLRDRFVEEFLP